MNPWDGPLWKRSFNGEILGGGAKHRRKYTAKRHRKLTSRERRQRSKQRRMNRK